MAARAVDRGVGAGDLPYRAQQLCGNLEYGYGAAMALVLVVVGVLLSLIYLRLFNYRVLVAKPLIEN